MSSKTTTKKKFISKNNFDFALGRFLNEEELQPSDTFLMEYDEKQAVYSLVITELNDALQGTIKAVLYNSGGEIETTAELEVRGRAPTFVEVPLKCTLLEGRI